MPVLDPELVPALTRAVEDGGLQVHFQPEIDLASGAVVGMEALLRWAHPTRGLLWPAQFLPVARVAGLQDRIGRWTAQECVAEAARWSSPPTGDGAGPQLRINFSAWEFDATERFLADVPALVAACRLPRGTLALELGEAALSGLAHRQPTVVAGMRTAGIAIAISDARAWRTALATGAAPPVEIVKLSRRAVSDLGAAVGADHGGPQPFTMPSIPEHWPSDAAAWTSVAASVALAHERGLLVVAEGVESWIEGAALWELGCDRAHGLLFCGPQRADRARDLVRSGTGWLPASGGWRRRR